MESNISNSEISRKERALKKGLPENATWRDINKHSSEISRKEFALKKGLPENATWGDIVKSNWNNEWSDFIYYLSSSKH